MNNILITGSKGQLGSELHKLITNGDNYQDSTFFFTDKEELDITCESDINTFAKTHKITAIINCAAYTAVDNAQTDELNADKINHLAVKYLASIAKENALPFIHISTDYVFDGTKYMPYDETDTTNPQSVYGKTKLDGEKALQSINPNNSIIIRTSWVYSSYGTNFVKTMLRLGNERDSLGIIYDQIGTPTYAGDLAQSILDILPQLNNNNVEIYHYSNEGVCSWYDFAQTIFEINNISCDVNAIESKEYPTPAKRPHYSLLNKSKIKQAYKIAVPYWKESLLKCLDEINISS